MAKISLSSTNNDNRKQLISKYKMRNSVVSLDMNTGCFSEEIPGHRHFEFL